MRIIFLRLKQMLLGWGTVGIVYSCCDRLQGQGSLLTPWAIDRVIPFSPTAVWLYLSFFLLIPAGYFLVPLMQLRWLTRAMQIAAIGAGSIYLMWPTTMQYPPLIGDGPSSQVLGWLIGVDSPQNCFPSLHAGLTLLTVWAIAVRRQTVITTVSLVWALAIAISILQLRRHLFVDLVGGGLLAGGSGWLAMYIDAGKKQHREIRYE